MTIVMVKYILESFGALVIKWPVFRKRLIVEQNGVKFATHEHKKHRWDTFDLVVFMAILGHAMHLFQNCYEHLCNVSITITTAVAKQNAKVHGPLAQLMTN